MTSFFDVKDLFLFNKRVYELFGEEIPKIFTIHLLNLIKIYKEPRGIWRREIFIKYINERLKKNKAKKQLREYKSSLFT